MYWPLFRSRIIRFFICFIISGVCFFLFVSGRYTVRNSGETDIFLMMGEFLSGDLYCVLCPALVSFLCSDILYEKLSGRTYYLELIRSSRLKYIIDNITVILISAFLWVFLNALGMQVISTLRFGISSYMSFSKDLYRSVDLFMGKSFSSFLLLAIWGLLGSLFGMILKNRSAAYVMPFALNYILKWLSGNYIKNLRFLDSSYWYTDALYQGTGTTVLTFLCLAISLVIVMVIYGSSVNEHLRMVE